MNKKLAPELRVRLRSQSERRSRGENETSATEALGRVGILVEFTGDIADLTAAGFEAQTVVRHAQQGYQIATGTIAVDRLDDLAAIDHVVEVEGPRRFQPLLNYSRPEVRANAVHSGSPAYKGEGVVVGIIDTGIDWRHGAFAKDDGSSRILGIWDQRLRAKTGETKGIGGVGVVYEPKDISNKTARTRDKNGHGTHVAGIAAGNGKPACCCRVGGTYVGIAPQADLIAVRYDFTHDDDLGANVRLVQALGFIFNHSEAAGKPVVVNISLGDNLGPHDGTSEVERAIDAFVSGHPSRAVVVAAGNFADTRCHVKGVVPQNGHLEVEFTVREGHRPDAYLDLWYDRAGELHIELTPKAGPGSGPVHHGLDHSFIANPTAAADRRSRVFIDGTANGPHNRDNNFRIHFVRPRKGNLPHGDWKLKLTNPTATAVNFHCWIDRGDDEHQPVFLPAVDQPDDKIRSSSDSTLSAPSTAAEAITVANHQSKTDWCNCWPSHDIEPSSSRGPVARGAAVNRKPDIAAPGLLITSVKADAANLRGNCCDCCPDACCCLYTDDTGTSMAAPHVTGAIALMLDKDSALTKADILRHLQDTARPAPAGGTRETWGAGKLNVEGAVNAVAAPQPGGGGGGGPNIRADFDFDGEGWSPKWVHDLAPRSSYSNHGPARSTLKSDPVGASLPPLLRALKSRLSERPDGELLAALVSRNFSEVRRLINTNPRVATMWHRSDGPRMLRRLVNGTIDAEAPAAILSQEQREYVERWCDLLDRYGSRRLKESVERYRRMVIHLLLTPLAARSPLEMKAN